MPVGPRFGTVFRHLAGLSLLANLVSCYGGPARTSSGTYIHGQYRDYDIPRSGDNLGGTAASASARPLLRFPARIGIARIANDRIAPIPPREADIWIAFEEAHRNLGEFVPMNPLIAAFADNPRASRDVRGSIADTVRVAAAQQHMDAVLLYTTGVESSEHATPLSILDVTLIGGYLVPSRRLQSQATATARLVDVRNGYNYANLGSTGADTGLVPDFGSDDYKAGVAHGAEVKAVEALSAEVGALTAQLRTSLAGSATSTAANIGPVR